MELAEHIAQLREFYPQRRTDGYFALCQSMVSAHLDELEALVTRTQLPAMGEPGEAMQVTPEMIEAGVKAIRALPARPGGYVEYEAIARAAYLAMSSKARP